MRLSYKCYILVPLSDSACGVWIALIRLPCSQIQRKRWHPLQYFCLENPMDGGAWEAAVHGVARVGHDWATSLSLFTFMHWRRKWQPTPVSLPGASQGWGSLVGCCLWVAQSRTRLKWAAVWLWLPVYWRPQFLPGPSVLQLWLSCL